MNYFVRYGMEFDQDILKAGLDQVLKIAHDRAMTLENLRSALLEDDIDKIKFYASQLCGLNGNNYESSRISQSINPRAG